MRSPAWATASLALAILFIAPVAPAQDQGLFVEFNFDTLWFRVYPHGLGGDAEGSGIQVFAENVAVVEYDAVDLRHCIDGHDFPECSYGDLLARFSIGNRDGQVTTPEVQKFQSVAVLGVGEIEKVKNLSRMLEENVTLDGFHGDRARAKELVVRAAEGPVNSTETAFVDVTIEVSYGNDPKAKRHEIHLQSVNLKREGFVYDRVQWAVVGGERWAFKASETEPLNYQTKVAKEGWSSSQNEFESATQNGLRLVLEQEAKKKSPGVEAWALLAVGAVAVAVLRRRR